MLTNSEGKVSPSTFPVPNASPDYIEGLAADLRTAGESVADTGNDINGSWSGLTNCYKAPEAAELYTVLAPVASNGDDVSTGMGQAATALETFAADLRSIKSRWSTLRAEAYEFRARIDAEGEDWRKGDGWFGFGDSANVEENDRLIERGQNLIEEYEEAERVCANGVNKFVPDRTRFEAAPKGDGALDPGVFYHGYEQDLSDLATEWELGGAEMDANWVVDVGSAVWDFGVDAVEGTGAMLGMHSSEGWFQASWGDALWEYHEGNVQSALSMVGMYDAESDSYGWAGWDSVGSAWKDAAHAVVPWEEWGDRPGYVIGTALLNIGATVGGALLTATGVGAVVGVPLMAWRGMAMLDSMGGGRGGSGGGSGIDVDVPQNFPAFGGQGSPVINIDTSRFSDSGALSAQLTDANSALNRLLASTGESSTSTGGDNPRTQNTSGEQAPRVSSPNRDKEKENVSRKAGTDPTAQQLKDTEDLLSQLGPADVAELQRTERDVLAEGGSRGSESSGSRQAEEAGLDPSLDSVFAEGRALASDYPAWEMGPLRDGPEGDRVPAHVGGGNPDPLTAARDVPSSSSPSRLDLTDIGGDRFPDTPDHHRDTGSHDRDPDLRDDRPGATNRTDLGEDSDRRSEADRISERDPRTVPDPENRREGESAHQHGSNGRDSGPTNTSMERLSVDHGGHKEDDTPHGAPPENSTPEERPQNSFKKDEDAEIPTRKFDGVTRGELNREISQEINLKPDTPHKEFAKKFTDFLNEKIRNGEQHYFHEFYNSNGIRFRIERTIFGFKIPQLTSVNGSAPWYALETLPDPDPPNYRMLNDRAYFSAEDSKNTGPDIDNYAEERREAIKQDLAAEEALRRKKDEHKEYPGVHPEVLKAEEYHSPLHGEMSTKSETYGEEVAKVAVKDLFDGQHSFTGKDGMEIPLPKLAADKPYDTPGAPASKNYQFDQIWPLEGGGILIVEAKSSQSTSLGDRTIPVNGQPTRISQGTPDYLEATTKDMKKRSRLNPVGDPTEARIAEMIEEARRGGKLYYAEVKGITPEQKEKALGEKPNPDEKHSGYSFGLFDIPKRGN
ncbi:hypothetical protein [Nocardiopsis sp. FR6]|uniref:hypothetical protein n=1 Tax=Nocardiopsis sp. FR6 TaxID=2605986 RepID=UPI00135B061B|nr:hypothetical protein [Nocardiopsis sp. FR6]